MLFIPHEFLGEVFLDSMVHCFLLLLQMVVECPCCRTVAIVRVPAVRVVMVID